MKFILLLVLLSKISFILNEDKSITIPLVVSTYGVPGIRLSLGNPPQSFEFYVSTILHKTYIISYDSYKEGFHIKNSTTFNYVSDTPVAFPSISENAEGIISKDTLTLDTLKLDNFDFILMTKGNFGFHYIGSIGFEYKPENEDDYKYSLVNRLYDTGAISHKVFYFVKKYNTITLTIGTFPNDYFTDKRYKFCSLSPNANWQCIMNAVYFDDVLYPVRAFVNLSMSGNIICVDDNIYNQIKNKYFIEAMQKSLCQEDKRDGKKTLICIYPFQIPEDPDISFMYGKWSLTFKLNKLFFISGDYDKWLSIMKCNANDFVWSMGYYYIPNSVIVFDKENKRLGINLNNVN